MHEIHESYAIIPVGSMRPARAGFMREQKYLHLLYDAANDEGFVPVARDLINPVNMRTGYVREAEPPARDGKARWTVLADKHQPYGINEEAYEALDSFGKTFGIHFRPSFCNPQPPESPYKAVMDVVMTQPNRKVPVAARTDRGETIHFKQTPAHALVLAGLHVVANRSLKRTQLR